LKEIIMGNAGYGNHTENTKDTVDSKRIDPQAGRKAPSEDQPGQGERNTDPALPAAGPHDKPSLTNPDATPGTGALPTEGEHDSMDSTSS
jgi:hypothetical protein